MGLFHRLRTVIESFIKSGLYSGVKRREIKARDKGSKWGKRGGIKLNKERVVYLFTTK